MLVKGFDRMLAAATETAEETAEDLLTLTTTAADQTFSFLANRDARTTVYWGDGSKSTYPGSASQATYSHTYAEPGDYTVKVTSIARLANLRCNSARLTAVVNLPRLVNDNIAASAFDGATNLVSIPLPDKVLAIGNYAFRNCSNLELDGLPETTTSIGVGAFNNCLKMRLAYIPASVKTIGNQAFRYIKEAFDKDRMLFLGTPTTIGNCFLDTTYRIADLFVPWASGAVSGAGWGTDAQIRYNITARSTEELEEWLQTTPRCSWDMDKLPEDGKTDPGHAVALVGTEPTVEEVAGMTGYKFPAASYYLVTSPFSKAYGYGKRVSASLWLKLDANPKSGAKFFRVGVGPTGAGCSFLLGVPNDNNYGVCACVTGNSTLMNVGNISTAAVFPRSDRDWHHIVLVCYDHYGWTASEGNEIRLYLDGQFISSVTRRFTSNSRWASQFVVGNWDNSSGSVYIAGLRLFQTLLTQESVTRLYNEYHPTQE